MLLTQMGYEVFTALDGHSATEELRRNDYDLVITDLMMDGSTGYDILDFVSSEQLNIPVLVLTGLGSVDAAVKALKQGAYDYILKPFQFDSFRSCVRRAIEKRQLELIQRLQTSVSRRGFDCQGGNFDAESGRIFQIIVNQSREFVEFNSAPWRSSTSTRCIDLFTLLLTAITPQFRHRILRFPSLPSSLSGAAQSSFPTQPDSSCRRLVWCFATVPTPSCLFLCW
jgi:CheY-like chemotaxis protein